VNSKAAIVRRNSLNLLKQRGGVDSPQKKFYHAIIPKAGNLGLKLQSNNGSIVEQVDEGGLAAQAGVKPLHCILQINGQDVPKNSSAGGVLDMLENASRPTKLFMHCKSWIIPRKGKGPVDPIEYARLRRLSSPSTFRSPIPLLPPALLLRPSPTSLQSDDELATPPMSPAGSDDEEFDQTLAWCESQEQISEIEKLKSELARRDSEIERLTNENKQIKNGAAQNKSSLKSKAAGSDSMAKLFNFDAVNHSSGKTKVK
jgi:hypothetical protein